VSPVMSIIYKINAPLLAQQLSDVFRSAGMKRPVDDLERLQRMIDNADVTISAWDGEQLVGIARAVTDYSYCCYLSDLAVRNEYQKSGIGSELVQQLRDHLSEEVALLLLSAPAAMDYYPRIGFEKTDRAFLINRSK
jgi:predicted N-acetyltransferase YhbS